MKRVLLIAYYFPPLGGIGSVRVTNYARHLADYGWDATVLAPRNGAYHRDPDLGFPEDRVIRTGSLELSRTGKRLLRAGGSDTAATVVGGPRNLVKGLVRRRVYFPDAQIGWYLPAVLQSFRHLRPGSFDAIFSTSFPVTSHLIARTLHRRLGVPWVAEFRDPWSHSLSAYGNRSTRAERLERALAREASALVTVSPTWARMFSDTWGREVAVITNGHDGAATRHTPLPSEAFTLGYAGTFYPGRQDLDAVWTAVALLNRKHRQVDAIRVIGAYDGHLAARVADRGAGNLLAFTGYLRHANVLDALMGCTALVVAGPLGASALDRGWIVAKIFEYLATDRPIIYLGGRDTDAAQLLMRFAGTHIVHTGDVDGAARALQSARSEVIKRDTSELSRQSITGKLATLLDERCG